MSDSRAVSLTTKSSARAFAHTLIFGGLVVMSLFLFQSTLFSARIRSAHLRPPLLAQFHPALIDLVPEEVTAEPSAYDVESTMTAAQLLDRWDNFVSEASRRFHVPKAWIRAVMARESGGRTMLAEGQPIVSRAGAIGLMQVLPATYEQMREENHLGANPFDARDNIMAGTAYLRWLHGKYGYPAMFAAYNAGPGRLVDHIERGVSLPKETRAYVGGITRLLNAGHAGAHLLVKLTSPDGDILRIDATRIASVREALPGEYAPGVKTVLNLGKYKRQGVRESVASVSEAIRAVGGLI